MTADTNRLKVGVVGVGSMGQHHARVYRDLPSVELVGVSDLDAERAEGVAERYETRAMLLEPLLDTVDAISIAVPTRYHAEVARAAIDRGVHVLVEKPFVDDVDDGHDLIDFAERRGVVLQVGHVERFNPAVVALRDVLDGLEIVAVDARRLGVSPDRDIGDDAVLDLMIHDIDVVRSILGDDAAVVSAAKAGNDPYVTAMLEYGGDTVVTFTASRTTQRKVRELWITTRDCLVQVDYIQQSIQIHRHAVPEYVEDDGSVRYRYESVVEYPHVEAGEPLRDELSAFVEAIRTGTEPLVTGEDGLRALELATRIERATRRAPEKQVATVTQETDA